MIRDYVKKVIIANYPNPRMLGCILLRNVQRLVRAAIVENEVFPIGIGLREYASNTLPQIGGAVENGCYYANLRLGVDCQSSVKRRV